MEFSEEQNGKNISTYLVVMKEDEDDGDFYGDYSDDLDLR